MPKKVQCCLPNLGSANSEFLLIQTDGYGTCWAHYIDTG